MSFVLGRAMGSSGVAPRHELDNFGLARLPPQAVPWRRIAPAGHQPRNVIPGEWTEVRVTAGCHRSASKVAGVPTGPGGERKPASYARKGRAFCQLAECRKPLPERSASTQEYRRRWAPGAG